MIDLALWLISETLSKVNICTDGGILDCGLQRRLGDAALNSQDSGALTSMVFSNKI